MDLWMGGALIGLAGALAAARGYIVGFWNYLSSFVIVSHQLTYDLGWTVCEYALRNYSRSPYGTKQYGASMLPYRATRQHAWVAYELLTHSSLFWVGWRPLRLYSAQSRPNNPYSEHHVQLTCIRGTVDVEKLLMDAVKQRNQLRQGAVADRSRFRVQTLGGTWSLLGASNNAKREQSAGAVGTAGANNFDVTGNRLLGVRREDIGIAGEQCCRLEDLALSDDAERVVTVARRWYASREWYERRRVPWKLGLRFVGLPGNGKTALSRAIAFLLDMPVFMFDLATMTNDDLRDAWKIAMSETPCICLFEDIDAVFHGRTPVHKEAPLTFDTLLQCLDGVEQHAGVLTIVTTNLKEHLDPALCRPGRTDFELDMLPPDETGRRKIADRIVGDWPEIAERLVREHAGVGGAAFQHICTQEALRMFWRDASKSGCSRRMQQQAV